MSDSGPLYIVDPHPGGGEVVSLSAHYEDVDHMLVMLADLESTGRLFVGTSRAPAVGVRVTVVATFPGLLRPLHLAGQVVDSIPAEAVEATDGGGAPEPSAGAGARVELVAFDGDAKSRLKTLVDKLETRDADYVARAVRVLVVEDNPHCAKLIQEGLHLAGRRAFGNRVVFDVPMASNAADAFTFLHSGPIDVLITDIYLGGVSGTTVIEHVRRDSGLRSIPVIAISAGDEATRQVAMEAGADVFLPKPVRLRQIVGSVGEVLNLEQIAWR